MRCGEHFHPPGVHGEGALVEGRHPSTFPMTRNRCHVELIGSQAKAVQRMGVEPLVVGVSVVPVPYSDELNHCAGIGRRRTTRKAVREMERVASLVDRRSHVAVSRHPWSRLVNVNHGCASPSNDTGDKRRSPPQSSRRPWRSHGRDVHMFRVERRGLRPLHRRVRRRPPDPQHPEPPSGGWSDRA